MKIIDLGSRCQGHWQPVFSHNTSLTDGRHTDDKWQPCQ